MRVPNDELERGISPLYSWDIIQIRLFCAAALTIVVQKSTLTDLLKSQPPSFRMKWQMRSVPSSLGLRCEDVVVPSVAPFPTRTYGCAGWGPSEGSAFADPFLGVVSASQLGQELRANVYSKTVRMKAFKFPGMNTCIKRAGGTPSPFSVLAAPPAHVCGSMVALAGAQ